MANSKAIGSGWPTHRGGSSGASCADRSGLGQLAQRGNCGHRQACHGLVIEGPISHAHAPVCHPQSDQHCVADQKHPEASGPKHFLLAVIGRDPIPGTDSSPSAAPSRTSVDAIHRASASNTWSCAARLSTTINAALPLSRASATQSASHRTAAVGVRVPNSAARGRRCGDALTVACGTADIDVPGVELVDAGGRNSANVAAPNSTPGLQPDSRSAWLLTS